MPPPKLKPLPPHLEELVQKLFGQLDSRTVPLTAAGEESLGRAQGFAPEMGPIIDEALQKGEVKEVGGGGKNLLVNDPYFAGADDRPAQAARLTRRELNKGANSNVGPYAGFQQQPSGAWETPEGDIVDPWQLADDADVRIYDAQETNRNINEATRNPDAWPQPARRVLADSGRAANSKVGFWPRAWVSQENIPAIIPPLAAAGVAGAALAPGQAQAAGPAGLKDALPEQGPSGPFPWSGATKRNFGQAGVDIIRTATGENVEFWKIANKFKKAHIDPLVRSIQENNRALFIQDPFKAGRVGKPDEPGVLGKLRDTHPVASFGAENLGKLALGETEVNKPGSEHPTTQEALRQLEFHGVSPTGTAALQSLLQEGSNLPFYLIPGAGRSAVAQGATGGFLSSLADPQVDDLEFATKSGAVLGGVLQKGIEALPKLKGALQTIKDIKRGGPARNITPIAVVPGDEVDNLTAGLLALEESAVPSKTVPKQTLAVIVDATPEGNVERFAIIPGDTVVARPSKVRLGDAAEVPSGVKVMATPPVRERLKDPIPTDPDAFDKWRIERGFGLEPQPSEVLDLGEMDSSWLTRRMAIQDWDAGLLRGEPNEDGLVLAWNDQDMVKLYDLASPELRQDLLIAQGLSEVTLSDGRKVLAYDGGKKAPDPGDLIPRAATAAELAETVPSKVRVIDSPAEITRVDREIRATMKAMEDAVDLDEAAAKVAQADIANGGDGSGGSLPPQGPAVPPSVPPPPPPPTGITLHPIEDVKLKWWQAMANKISRKSLPPTARGPIDQADLAAVAHSLDSFDKLRVDVHERLQLDFPQLAKYTPAQVTDFQFNVGRYIDGDLKLSDLQAKHPDIAETQFQILEREKAEIARNDLELRSLGMLESEQDLKRTLKLGPEDELPDYGVRMYLRHSLRPGEWQKIAKRDTQGMEALTRAIVDDVYSTKAYQQMPLNEREYLARRHLDFLLGDPQKMADARKNPEGAWKDVVSEAQGSLKRRGDLRWWEKAALGEVDSGFIRIAESRTRQKQLILQGHMWKSVADNPNLSTRADNAPKRAALGHTQQVPMQPGKYGLAAGSFVSPETWEALVQIPLAQRNVMGTIGKIVNALKWGKTVGNPGSWVTNWLSNAQNAMMSNLTNPWASPLQIGNGMRLFAADTKAYKLAPGHATSPGQKRYLEAMKRGIIGSDFASHEFQIATRDWANVMEKQQRLTGGVNWQDMFTDMLGKAKNGVNSLNKYYSAIDTMWKYATWTSGLQKGGINLSTGQIDQVKAAKFLGKHYRQGMEGPRLEEAVMNEVSRRIHLSFPMLDRVAPVVNTAGKAAGVLNPFIKVRLEQMRVYGQLPSRLREPGMLSNLIGFGTIIGTTALGYKMAREHAGMSQTEVDQTFASAPESLQRFKPGAFALWYRDQLGRPQFVDMTSSLEPLSYLQGDPNLAAPKRILQNMAMSPVDGSILEPELVDILAAGGVMDPNYRKPQVAEWQKGNAAMMGEIMGRVLPGAFRNTYNTLERGGVGFAPKSSTWGTAEPQSAGTTVTNLLAGPNRTFAVGSQADKDKRLMSETSKLYGLIKELNSLSGKTEGQSTGMMSLPLDKEAALQKATKAIEEKAAEIERLERQLGR